MIAEHRVVKKSSEREPFPMENVSLLMDLNKSIEEMNLANVKGDLIKAFQLTHERGLKKSAKWISELLFSLKAIPLNCKHVPSCNDDEEHYPLIKSYFDLQEFDRAAFFSKDYQSSRVMFLHFYSKYLSSEKKRQDNVADVLIVTDSQETGELEELRVSLMKLLLQDKLDGFCIYLLGIILKKLNLSKEAYEMFLKAVNLEPLHWGSWIEIASLITDRENHFFLAHTFLELQMNNEALQLYNSLLEQGLMESTYILAQVALAYHNMREVDLAMDSFREVQRIDPYRVDNMDTYSNLLFVKNMIMELSVLAHHLADIDKYRVETCCVIGNYYSLHAQHEKAVVYFQRALRLNPYYLSAWTLLGHEFVELKNTNAAIQSYRQAIEINRRDFRAWYGLGQTYEMLKMPFYSLYYYKQAHFLRPNDSRMLVAMGDIYEKMDKLQEAKKCFWKAHSVGDIECSAILKLAKLYERLFESTKAAAAYTKYLFEMEGDAEGEETAHAHIFLANHHLKMGSLDEAYEHAQKCTEYLEVKVDHKLPSLKHLTVMKVANTVIDACIHLHSKVLNFRRMRKTSHLSHIVRVFGQMGRNTKMSARNVEEQVFPVCECWTGTPVSFSELEASADSLKQFLIHIPMPLVQDYMLCVYSRFFPPHRYICTLLLAFHPLAPSIDFRLYMADMFNICKAKVDESFLLNISKICPVLQKLCVPPFRLSEQGVTLLGNFRHLQWVDLRYSYEVAPSTVSQLLAQLPRLIFLYYWMMAEVLDALCLLNCPSSPYHLQYICLRSPSQRHIYFLKDHLPHLRHLTLKESILKKYNDGDAPLSLHDLTILDHLPNLTIHTWNVKW